MILRNFKVYDGPVTDDQKELRVMGVMFLISSDGKDWYQSQKDFLEDTLKVEYDPKTKVIKNASYDASKLFPQDLSVAEVKSFPKRFKINGPYDEFIFNEEKEIIATRVYSNEDLKLIVERKKSQLMAETMALIDPLKFAVDLDMATEEEKSKLESLKKYVVMLNRVPQQETYPSGVTWPEIPTT